MRVVEITAGGQPQELRLTTGKLLEYIRTKDKDAPTPLLAVLDSMDDLDKQTALLSAALTWPSTAEHPNSNTMKSGAQLLDALVETGSSQATVKELIIRLAVASGLASEDDGAQMLASVAPGNAHTVQVICNALRGEQITNTQGEHTPSDANHPT